MVTVDTLVGKYRLTVGDVPRLKRNTNECKKRRKDVLLCVVVVGHG